MYQNSSYWNSKQQWKVWCLECKHKAGNLLVHYSVYLLGNG